MDLAQDKINLIKKLVRADKKFSGNEDLFEDFVNEACKRALVIIETFDDASTLEVYLKKIVSTSILVVLKDLGRVRRNTNNYVSVQNVPIESVQSIEKVPDYSYIQFQPTPEEIVVKNDILQAVCDSVEQLDKENESKQYLKIYYLRYVKGEKQHDIAFQLGLSQSEVSKRLFKLMDSVKTMLEK